MSLNHQLKRVKEEQDVIGMIKELAEELKSLRQEMAQEHMESRKTIGQLSEEITKLRLEVRRQGGSPNSWLTTAYTFDDLPYTDMERIQEFDTSLQNDKELLMSFKLFIDKIGGMDTARFIRTAVRKVFSDSLASQFSWKGTKEKPSAEKCYCISVIKDICQRKYLVDDKFVSTIMHKHFLHAKERIKKLKGFKDNCSSEESCPLGMFEHSIV